MGDGKCVQRSSISARITDSLMHPAGLEPAKPYDPKSYTGKAKSPHRFRDFKRILGGPASSKHTSLHLGALRPWLRSHRAHRCCGVTAGCEERGRSGSIGWSASRTRGAGRLGAGRSQNRVAIRNCRVSHFDRHLCIRLRRVCFLTAGTV